MTWRSHVWANPAEDGHSSRIKNPSLHWLLGALAGGASAPQPEVRGNLIGGRLHDHHQVAVAVIHIKQEHANTREMPSICVVRDVCR
jgi:hypothetical protein